MKKKRFTRAITVMLSEEVFNALEKITNQHEMSISEWVRQIVQENLECMAREMDEKKEEGCEGEKS